MARSDGIDRVHVGGLTVEAYGHDDFGARRDGSFDFCRIEVPGCGIDVGEDGDGSDKGDHFARCEEGKRRSYHFIIRLDAERQESEEERIGSAGTGDAIFRAGAGGEAAFQLADLGAQDVLAVVENGVNAGVDGGLQVAVLRLEVDEIHASIFSGS